MAAVQNNLRIEYQIGLTLNETEARALDGLVGYGDDAFIKHFKENLGTHYIRDHVDGLKSFFKTVREQVLPELYEIDELRRTWRQAAEREQLATEVRQQRDKLLKERDELKKTVAELEAKIKAKQEAFK